MTHTSEIYAMHCVQASKHMLTYVHSTFPWSTFVRVFYGSCTYAYVAHTRTRLCKPRHLMTQFDVLRLRHGLLNVFVANKEYTQHTNVKETLKKCANKRSGIHRKTRHSEVFDGACATHIHATPHAPHASNIHATSQEADIPYVTKTSRGTPHIHMHAHI